MGSHTYATRHWIASCYSVSYMFWQLKAYFDFRFRYCKVTSFFPYEEMIDKIIFLFRVVRKLEKLESHFVIFQIAVGDTNRGE